MKEQAIIALVGAVIANAPVLSADVQRFLEAITELVRGNPGATRAEIEAKIKSALDDAAAIDKQIEGAGV